MKILAFATACTLLSIPAMTAPSFAQSVGEKTGVNALTGTSPTTADFVKEAAISDMFEIQSSELADQKSNGATKAFASKMIADHTKISAELKKMVAAGDVNASIPSALDSSHQSMIDKLKGAERQRFRQAVPFRPGQRPQGRRIALRAIFEGRRERQTEELGRHDAADAAGTLQVRGRSRQISAHDVTRQARAATAPRLKGARVAVERSVGRGDRYRRVLRRDGSTVWRREARRHGPVAESPYGTRTLVQE